jgi:hypothetical protein
MDLDAHQPAVARALQALEKSLERLVEALAHRPVWLKVAGVDRDGEAVRRVCEAYATIDYGMDDAAGQSSPVCLGLVGAAADVIACAERVNAAKAALKAVCMPLQKIRTRVPVKGEGGPTRAIPVIRAVLRSLQRSDVNLKAAYRKIPILAAPPRSVHYTRARTRNVYRKPLDEIAAKLADFSGPDAAQDREALARISRTDDFVALVTDHYENIRANIVYERLDKRGRGRVQVPAELPLLYAQGRHPAAPEVEFPPAVEEGTDPSRQPRRSKLESEPCLRSLPVYRYAR